MFDFYVEHEYLFAVAQLILAMLGMGATLAPADFLRVVSDPKGLTVGLVLQLVATPAVAYLFILMVSDNQGLAIGIAVCSAIPGGTVSNIFTYLARGHAALSIALTGITAMACLVTTPLVLEILITQYLPENFDMPAGRIATEIGVFLLLPLICGMAYLRFFPAGAPFFSRWCIRGSLFVIALIVIGALGSGRIDLVEFGLVNMAWVWAFIVVLVVMSRVVPELLRNTREDIIAINMEVTVRNTSLGILIKASLLPATVGVADPVGDSALFTILLYGGLMLIISACLIPMSRRRMARVMRLKTERHGATHG